MKSKYSIMTLEEDIKALVYKIAPEKKEACASICEEYDISILFSNESDFKIRTKMETKTIVLPIAALDYLWAFSHYSWVLTQEYGNSQKDGVVEFNCVGNNRLQESNSLYEWAKKNLIEFVPLPNHLPSIDTNNIDSAVATELFLCSLGWMLHHEIGHIALQHPYLTTNRLSQEEIEADLYATDWLLSELDKNSPERLKRAMGVAIGVLCLQSLEVNNKSNNRDNSYPNAHDRVFKSISKYEVGDEEVIQAHSMVILQYIFHEQNIKININGSSFDDMLNTLLCDISRNNK